MPTAPLDRSLDALADQWSRLLTVVAALTDADRARPSVLAGWTVGDLVGHLAQVAGTMHALPTAPERTPPMTLAAYVSRYGDAREGNAAAARDAGAGAPGDVLMRIRTLSAEQVAALRWVAARPGADRAVVSAQRGPLRLVDAVTSRVLEVVVHADDLARSLPGPVPDPVGRAGLRVVTRALATALADVAPGHTVELRVPPYAAVQCVAGPRHTRGTPPNVVETDPLTWVRLATGRVGWSPLAGTPALSASGDRADLSGLLPLL